MKPMCLLKQERVTTPSLAFGIRMMQYRILEFAFSLRGDLAFSEEWDRLQNRLRRTASHCHNLTGTACEEPGTAQITGKPTGRGRKQKERCSGCGTGLRLHTGPAVDRKLPEAV